MKKMLSIMLAGVLLLYMRVYRGSYTKKAKNSYFNYFKHQF